jgi:hypothetical protein
MDVGNEFKGAVTLAFDAVDWQIGPYTIEPVWIDSPSDPDAAVAGGIQAAILNWHSSVAAACMDVAAAQRVQGEGCGVGCWHDDGTALVRGAYQPSR